MDIRPIHNDEDHSAALREIERLWGAGEGTPEGDRLDALVVLVEAYENGCFPLDQAKLDTIIARFAALPILDGRTADEIIGYDENGLPS